MPLGPCDTAPWGRAAAPPLLAASRSGGAQAFQAPAHVLHPDDRLAAGAARPACEPDRRLLRIDPVVEAAPASMPGQDPPAVREVDDGEAERFGGGHSA